jgi:hypothetical protein
VRRLLVWFCVLFVKEIDQLADPIAKVKKKEKKAGGRSLSLARGDRLVLGALSSRVANRSRAGAAIV